MKRVLTCLRDELVAISPDVGVMYYELSRNTMNGEKMDNFSDNLETIPDDEEAYIVMDNAPIHHHATMEHVHRTVKKLPPYLPFLNLLENSFSTLKFAVRRSSTKMTLRTGFLTELQLISNKKHLWHTILVFWTKSFANFSKT